MNTADTATSHYILILTFYEPGKQRFESYRPEPSHPYAGNAVGPLVQTGEVARFCKKHGMTFRRDDRFWGWIIAAHDEASHVLFKLTFDVDAPLWTGERNKTRTPYQYVPPPPPPRLALKQGELYSLALAVASECLGDATLEYPAVAIAHRSPSERSQMW